MLERKCADRSLSLARRIRVSLTSSTLLSAPCSAELPCRAHDAPLSGARFNNSRRMRKEQRSKTLAAVVVAHPATASCVPFFEDSRGRHKPFQMLGREDPLVSR